MNKIKRILVSVLSAIFLLGVTACTAKDDDGRVYTGDEIVINVGVFNGGYGYRWLREAANRFEDAQAQTQFGDYTGVRIRINPTRQIGENILDSIAVETNDMYFTEQMVNYNEFVQGGFLADISDIVTQEIPAQGHSIASAFKSGIADLYGFDGADGKKHYYTLPYANAYMQLNYDEELFYAKSLLLTREYDTQGNEGAVDDYVIQPIASPDANGSYAYKVTEGDKTYYKTTKGDYLSMGPDGEYGTEDDGQASTYKEFFALCDYMANEANVSPFVFGGGVEAEYMSWLINRFMIDYAGSEQARLSFTFDGTLEDIVSSVDNNGNITYADNALLTPDNANGNAKLIHKTESRYQALGFLERMYKNRDYFAPDCTKNLDQFRGQESFMLSKKDSQKSAFLVDGLWWQEEAGDTIKEMVEAFGDAYTAENRRFKAYSLPKADKSRLGKETILDTGCLMAFVFDFIDDLKKDVAKQFLQSCFTDESNKQFTLTTGVPRPYVYDFTAEEETKLTSYAKSVWNQVKAADVVYPYSRSPFYAQSKWNSHAMLHTKIGNVEYTNIVEVFKEKHLSVKTAFDGIANYYA